MRFLVYGTRYRLNNYLYRYLTVQYHFKKKHFSYFLEDYFEKTMCREIIKYVALESSLSHLLKITLYSVENMNVYARAGKAISENYNK